jgi:hypothetical protein
MKKHFNIKYKEQILSGELSVITGSDTPVRIIFIDDDVNHNDYPVYGFIKEEKTMFRWSLDGHIYEFDIEPSNLGKFNYDLYLIKTSNELTLFEQHLECICEEYMKLGTEYDSWDKTDEWIRIKAAKLKETLSKEPPTEKTNAEEFIIGHWYKCIANWGDDVEIGQLWLCHKEGWLTHNATDVRSDLGPNYFTPATDEEVHNDNKYNIGDIVNYHKSHNAVVKFLNILGIDDRGYYAEALKQDVANSLHFIKTKHFEVIPLNHYSFMELVKD